MIHWRPYISTTVTAFTHENYFLCKVCFMVWNIWINHLLLTADNVLLLSKGMCLIDNTNKCTTIKIVILLYLLVLSIKLFINAQTRIPLRMSVFKINVFSNKMRLCDGKLSFLLQQFWSLIIAHTSCHVIKKCKILNNIWCLISASYVLAY
jgi:hypothetical protein